MPRKSSTDKVVVERVEHGSVFPMNREEILKESIIDGHLEPFDLHGGIYATNLKVTGSGIIRGPILARDNISLEKASGGGVQKILSGMAAGASVFSQITDDLPILDNLASNVDALGFVIRGDIICRDKVRLQNCLVLGSISAPSIHINNCIVFGSISAEDSPGEFRATASCFGMYYAKRTIFEGPTTLTVVGGVSHYEPEFRVYKEINPDYNKDKDDKEKKYITYPFSARLLSLCRHEGSGCGLGDSPPKPERILKEEKPLLAERFNGRLGGVSCPYWASGICGYHDKIGIYKADFIQMALNVNKASDGTYIVEPIEKDPSSFERLRSKGVIIKWVFGLHSRAVELKRIEKDNTEFQNILHQIFAFEYLSPAGKKRLLKEINEKLSRDEIRLLPLGIEGL